MVESDLVEPRGISLDTRSTILSDDFDFKTLFQIVSYECVFVCEVVGNIWNVL